MIIAATVYILVVAYIMGKQERKRLGIIEFTPEELNELTTIADPALMAIRCPKKIWINFILTAVIIILLIWGIIPSTILFIAGTALGLVINYPSIADQRSRMEANLPDAGQVAMVVIAAGIFMGILEGTGMNAAIATSMTSIIPASLGKYWGLIVAILSAPGTFFLSNDAFYYGVLPVLAESGASYGFTSLQLGFASLTGQAFHLLSPLVPFIYVLLRLTDVDMGQWQKKSALWAIGIFIIYVIIGIVFGLVPLTA